MIYYVSGKADEIRDGSREHPFRHINDAAGAAQPGDEILVAPGIYREWVKPPENESL